MLRPIPRQILSQVMVLHVPTSVDTDYVTQYDNLVVRQVHLQDDYTLVKQPDNTEIQRKGIIFIDRRYSQPALDYIQLQEAANAIGARMRVTIGTHNYEIVMIDAVPDDFGQTHHYEVSVA